MGFKKILFLSALSITCFFRSNGQDFKYIEGIYHLRSKQSAELLFRVNGNAYRVPLKKSDNHGFSKEFPGNFLIRYTEANPLEAAVCYNRPYFPANLLVQNATATIIYVNDRYCDFQYQTGKANGEATLARQNISKEDRIKYTIQPGAVFKVSFMSAKPEVSILFWDQAPEHIETSPVIPFLSRPNGRSISIGLMWPFLNVNAINMYLKSHNQPLLQNKNPMLFTSIGQYWKSGLGFNFGLGLGSQSQSLLADFSYQVAMNRHFYLGFGTGLRFDSFDINSFPTEELEKVADTSRFHNSRLSISPHIDLMLRKISNNVWGTQFLKLSLGLVLGVSNSAEWIYQTGKSVPSKGKVNIYYSDAATLNKMPAMPNCLFMLSVSYSFMNFKSQ
jgi:hypothetical protein